MEKPGRHPHVSTPQGPLGLLHKVHDDLLVCESSAHSSQALVIHSLCSVFPNSAMLLAGFNVMADLLLVYSLVNALVTCTVSSFSTKPERACLRCDSQMTKHEAQLILA